MSTFVTMPRSRGSQLYLLQLLGVAVGLVLIGFDHWRIGVTVVGASFVASAIARISVPERHHGMLQVRGKAFDIAWTTLLGVGLIVLAAVIPPQPGQ